MIVPVVGAAPAGAAKFAWYPCRGELHTPPRHPAGMNDCTRGRGTHYERAVQVLRGRFTHCDDAAQVLHGRFTHCDEAVQVVHGRFTHCDDAVQVVHSRFTHCDEAMQVLHGHFAHCDDAAQVLRDPFTHCDGPRNGAYTIRPYPGTRHSCTRPNSQASVDAPAKFAGVRRRPDKLDRRP